MFPSARSVVSDGQSFWVTTFGDRTGANTTLRRIGATKGRVQATRDRGRRTPGGAYPGSRRRLGRRRIVLANTDETIQASRGVASDLISAALAERELLNR
jgi:hypothetical protein